MPKLSRRRLLQCSAAALLPLGAARSAWALNHELAFLVVGDWGDPREIANTRKVAAQMGFAADTLRADFIVSVGDNFYERGVGGIDDALWRQAFEDIYTAASLQCPWYAVLGNHDHYGNADAEIAYEKVSPRWRMPSRYYSRREWLSDGSAVDFFHLDTHPLARLSWMGSWLAAGRQVEEQLDWLARGLARSDAPWKIVIGHHPIYSGGKHGSSDRLLGRVRPLLDRYRVQAYISGHDHDLQHIVADDVHYLICGSGSAARETGSTFGTRFSAARLGFMTARMSPGEMEIVFVDATGADVYSARIPAFKP